MLTNMARFNVGLSVVVILVAEAPVFDHGNWQLRNSVLNIKRRWWTTGRDTSISGFGGHNANSGPEIALWPPKPEMLVSPVIHHMAIICYLKHCCRKFIWWWWRM